jgi:hypothetical protein
MSVGTLALVLYLGWQAWMNFGPRKPELSPLRRQIADEVIPQIVEDLRQGKKDIVSIVMFPLMNDTTDYLSDQLRGQIERMGIFDLSDRGLGEKLRKQFNLRLKGAADVDAALAASRNLGADGVLFGSIYAFESSAQGAKLEVRIMLAKINGQVMVFDRRYSKELAPGLINNAVVQEKMLQISWPQRLLGWVLVVLLLPMFTIGFIRAMVRKGSNQANASLLAIYTAVDAILAFLLVGAHLTDWVAVWLFLLLVGAAFVYNVFIMSFALKLET